MKLQLKCIILLILVFFGIKLDAQVLRSKSEVIELKGNEYTSGFTKEGNEYLLFTQVGEDKYGDTYPYAEQYIFYELENMEEPICIIKKIFEPSSMINEIVPILKRDYAELSYLKFKDYETNMIYKVDLLEIDDTKYCTITIYFDKNE